MRKLIKCDVCKAELKKEMDMSYSQVTQEYYCSEECEALGLHDYCQPSRIDVNDDEQLDNLGIKVYRGKLIYEINQAQ